jgi:hypothetical protein
MVKSYRGSFAWPILVAQLLLGGIIYTAVAVYPGYPKAALVIIYLLFCGILYFTVKGLKALWKKE